MRHSEAFPVVGFTWRIASKSRVGPPCNAPPGVINRRNISTIKHTNEGIRMKRIGDHCEDPPCVDPPCCEEVNGRLVEYLEGGGSDSTRARLNAHLRVCAQCQIFLAQYRKTIELIRTESAPEVPDGIAARILRRVDRRFERAEVLRHGGL